MIHKLFQTEFFAPYFALVRPNSAKIPRRAQRLFLQLLTLIPPGKVISLGMLAKASAVLGSGSSHRLFFLRFGCSSLD